MEADEPLYVEPNKVPYVNSPVRSANQYRNFYPQQVEYENYETHEPRRNFVNLEG